MNLEKSEWVWRSMINTDYVWEIILKYCCCFFLSIERRRTTKKIHTGAELPNLKPHFAIIGRQHTVPVKVSAASALPCIYIALCIGIANKETIATICHSFIAVFFFFFELHNHPLTCRCRLVIYIFAFCMQDKLPIMSFQDASHYINTKHLL